VDKEYKVIRFNLILERAHSPKINKILISEGVNAPDLLSDFEAQIHKITDLYDPNNTHWSSDGYIFAGNLVGNYILNFIKEK
jgi:hypothetical protein